MKKNYDENFGEKETTMINLIENGKRKLLL